MSYHYAPPLPSASSDTPLLPTVGRMEPSWTSSPSPPLEGHHRKHQCLRWLANPYYEQHQHHLSSVADDDFPCRRILIKSSLIALGCLTLIALFVHPSTSPSSHRLLTNLSTHLSPSSSRRDPSLHLLFPLDQRSHGERSCKSLLAAVVHGYKPTIVNWDVVGTPDELYSAKISGVYDYISRNMSSSSKSSAKARDGDMVLMLDSFDVWLQQSPRAMLRRFRELEAKIVIGADQYCWPNDPESEECKAAPESTVPPGVFGDTEPPRYANSGTVLGSVSDMRQFYLKLHTALSSRPTVNDQAFFNEMLPQAAREKEVAIDYFYRLFWTTAGPGEGVVLNVRHPIDGDEEDKTIPYELVPPIVYHSLSGEIPVALHFNADSTKAHYMESDALWGKLWWTSGEKRFKRIVRERLRTARIGFAHDGSQRRWKDVCPSTILDLGSFH